MATHLAKSSDTDKRVRTRWRWGIVIVLIGIVIAVYSFLAVQSSVSTPVAQPVTTASSTPTPAITAARPTVTSTPTTHVVAPESVTPAAPSAEPVVPASIPLKADPVRIEIPSARIDLQVLPLPASSIQGELLTPPNDSNAYSVNLEGVYDQPGAGSTDLSLIVAHACVGLAVCQQIDWQFNRLSDPTLVKAGTAVFVHTKNGKVCYRVDQDTVTYDKFSFSDEIDEFVFGSVPRPGKLVLVSCYTADVHAKNVAAVASMVSCDS